MASTTVVNWNYLRVRGEYLVGPFGGGQIMELPPRARRIRPAGAIAQSLAGTTSACAENTWGENPKSRSRRNYLRVRGEYPHVPSQRSTSWELPPRARRIRSRQARRVTHIGTTSACAENTA